MSIQLGDIVGFADVVESLELYSRSKESRLMSLRDSERRNGSPMEVSTKGTFW